LTKLFWCKKVKTRTTAGGVFGIDIPDEFVVFFAMYDTGTL
jgi:hypothetical protein